MRLLDGLHIEIWVPSIEMIGAVIIVGYAVAAVLALLRGRGITESRLLVAQGSLMGLSFKLAATLLKTILIQTWGQILFFAAILAIRIVLKRIFTGEEARLERRISQTEKVGSAV
jgi:uncharacterized membrane protein